MGGGLQLLENLAMWLAQEHGEEKFGGVDEC